MEPHPVKYNDAHIVMLLACEFPYYGILTKKVIKILTSEGLPKPFDQLLRNLSLDST